VGLNFFCLPCFFVFFPGLLVDDEVAFLLLWRGGGSLGFSLVSDATATGKRMLVFVFFLSFPGGEPENEKVIRWGKMH